MGSLTRVIIAASAVAAPFSADAADVMTMPVGTASVPVAGGGYDWDGFYAGVFGVTRNSPLYGFEYGLGLDVGATAHIQMVLVGGEVAIDWESSVLRSATTLPPTARSGSGPISACRQTPLLGAVLIWRSTTPSRWTSAISMGSRCKARIPKTR